MPLGTLLRGERRLEAQTYLDSGYGERIAIESKSGDWSKLGTLSRVWQPSRLKGIQVSKVHGNPFLAATQVFALRPSPRKFLSLDRTSGVAERFVAPGTILVTCSGNVGKATLAYRAVEGVLISHDLLRVDPHDPEQWGWLYAFLRSQKGHSMMTAAQYGHVIKHLETGHLDDLPVPSVGTELQAKFQAECLKILANRNEAVDLIEEAETLFSEAIGPVRAVSADGFTVGSASFMSTRRRLEAAFHDPKATAIVNRFVDEGREVVSLTDVTTGVWWMTRFRRVFGEGGMPYLSSDELFSINPTPTKHVMIEQAESPETYMVKAGWLMMACSGQTYGLNGAVALLHEHHEKFFFSHDIVRIVPDRTKIRPGYLYAALGHPELGRPLVIRNAYGTSIPHLDPSDVGSIPIVRLGNAIEHRIADLMERAVALRALADEIETAVGAEADAVIENFLHKRTT